MERVLLVDIGNHLTKLGVSENQSFTSILTSFSTHQSDSLFAQSICEIFDKQDYKSVILCSVVPSRIMILERILKEYKIPLMIVTPALELGIKLKYATIETLGTDRIALAVGAYYCYSLPQHEDTIVIDFGTAITADVIDHNGYYQGGIIFPGPYLLSSAIHRQTGQLPEVDFHYTDQIIGDNTKSCLQLGIQYALLGGLNSFLERVKILYQNGVQIIVTGGEAALFENKLEEVCINDPYLLFKGLAKIWEINKGQME